MKIGIMTFWWSQNNYGQLLQCYALQKYLRDLGHDAFLIRYNSDEELKQVLNKNLWKKAYKAFNPVALYHFVYYRTVKKSKLKTENENNPRFFDEFRKKHIVQSEEIYKSYKELQENPPKADCYIVGSDQVWNLLAFCGIKNDIYKAFFLDFGTQETQRISYAASWSILLLSKQEINTITPLLQKFNAISVREKAGIELCKQCGYKNPKWVCDPTFLLNAEKYRELYKSENIEPPKKQYLLFYMLNNKCDFNKQKVFDFAKIKNLEVVYVTGNGVLDNYKKTFATIPQWLSLVDNAEYVITNSFHCGVFSILLKKQFGIVPLTGDFAPMNFRFESLFDLFGMETRFISDNDFSVLDQKWNVNESELIQISKDFLENSLPG